MFFTNVRGLIKALRARKVSAGAVLIYSLALIVALIPWSLVALRYRTITLAPLLAATEKAAWVGTIGQWLTMALALIVFLHYNRHDGRRGWYTRLVALAWIVQVRLFLRVAGLAAVAGLTLYLSVMLRFLPKKAVLAYLAGWSGSMRNTVLAHAVLPLVVSFCFLWMFHTVVRELERA